MFIRKAVKHQLLKPCGTVVMLLLSIWAVAAQRQSTLSNRRPNVILIITGDQGYGDLGFHGNPKIQTPNLDRLARESVRFQP